VTIAELGIKLGYKMDKSSEQKAKASMNEVTKKAKQLAATIAKVWVAGKMLSFVKNLEAVKKATDEARKAFSATFKEFDKATGLSKSIAGLVKQVSGALLKMFDKIKPLLHDVVKAILPVIQKILTNVIEKVTKFMDRIVPKIRDLVMRLGGMENALKLIGIAAGAIFVAMNFKKITSGISGILKLINPATAKLALIAGAILLIALIVEDFIGYTKGKKSVFGDFWGNLIKIMEDINKNPAFIELKKSFGEFVDKIVAALPSANDLLQMLIDFLTDLMTKAVAWWNNGGADAFDGFVKGCQNALTELEKFIVRLGNGNFADGMIKALKIVGGLLAGIKIAKGVSKVAKVVSKVVNGGKKSVTAVKSVAKLLSKAGNAFANSGLGYKLLGYGAKHGAKSIGGAIAAPALGVLGGIAGAASAAWDIKDLWKYRKGTKEGDTKLGKQKRGKSVAGLGIVGASAAAGAALGTMIPIPGLGTLAGAGIGAGVGAIAHLLFKDEDEAKVVEAINSALAKAMTAIGNFFKGIGEGAKKAWEAVVNWFSGLPAWFKEIWVSITGWFSEKWTQITDFVSTVPGKIKDVFGDIKDWFKTNVIDPIVNFFSNLWDNIKGGVTGAVNNVKGWLADLIPGGRTSADYEGDSPPKTATGGIVTHPQTRIVGEDGAEAIMPLERNTGWINNLAQTLSGMMKYQNPQLQPALAGATYNISQTNNFSNTFNGSDREIQAQTGKVMKSNTKDATAQLARAIHNQR
jgi:phage-related protein